MSFKDWQDKGLLKPHHPSAQEIRALLALADQSLADSRIEALSTDGKLHAAYNAALTVGTAALHACGYRTNSNVPGHHATTIRSLEFTMRLDATVVRRLDAFRSKRNRSSYMAAGAVSEQEVTELREMSVKLREDFAVWLRGNHPVLV